MKRILLCSLLLAGLGLAACGRDEAGPSLQIGGHGIAFDDGDVTVRAGGRPSAVISAGGELRIGDTPVPLDAAQRQALLDYRTHLAAIRDQGIALGRQGTSLGTQAASEAIKGVFNGTADQVGARVEAEAGKIKQQAQRLCGQLAALKRSQDRVARTVPAFAPYAGLDQSDVDDCNK